MAARVQTLVGIVTVPNAGPSRLTDRKSSHPRAEGIATWVCASMPPATIQFMVRLEPLKTGGWGGNG